jgi:hypothetical protein
MSRGLLTEAASLAEKQQNSMLDLIAQLRRRLGQELQADAEQFQKLEKDLKQLLDRRQQLERAVQEQLQALASSGPSGSASNPASEPPMENVLAAVRNLITATLPEQVLDVLTEEAEQMGVRAAVFDVRGKAVWGSSARGFGPQLSVKEFHTVAVPLNQDNPFRQVYETGGHADVSFELLKKNKNVLDKLKPNAADPILLLPIRSAGAVSAIFYSDPGQKKKDLPVNALKILAEFAGAQLDRLMALSGGPDVGAREKTAEAERVGASDRSGGQSETEGSVSAEHAVGMTRSDVSQASATETDYFGELSRAAPNPGTHGGEGPVAIPAAKPAAIDVSQLSETDQKIHKDARRFAKLLVSEIELYNKAKVADGRKYKDLYKRLKVDIDRSRQTYEKRFGKTVGKKYDYLHDDLVKTLASNDPSMLGSGYPGPSV